MATIFVFGSNREGRHGKGAALVARTRFGAKYGQPRGLQGSSYAICTKELRGSFPPVTLDEVKREVATFLEFFHANPHSYYITRVGCGLAGFKNHEIAPLFASLLLNENVVYFPPEWETFLKENHA